MTEKTKNYFEELNEINVNDKIEKKNGLSYLSWAWAWEQIKKRHPDIDYKVIKDEKGLPYRFDEKTGYMVETEVTVNGKTHPMWLPVMDGANKAMKDKPYTYKVQKKEWNDKFKKYVRSKDKNGNFLFEEKEVEAATMFDINSSIMRCLVKNIAMHGLGLYIYAGEDLPEVGENAFGISKNLADETAEDMRIAAEEQRLSKLKTSLAEMGSIAEIDGYLEERNRLKVLMSMSQVNAAQAKTIIKNAKLAIDPEYRGE